MRTVEPFVVRHPIEPRARRAPARKAGARAAAVRAVDALPGLLAASSALLAGLGRLALAAWRRHRRIAAGLAQLRELDSRMLHDLGIDRGEIDRVVRSGRDR